MGSLHDALKKSGLATDEQIKKVEREKAEKARLDKASKEAKLLARREREFGHSMPQFIREAILERKSQVATYVKRAEKEMGPFPPEIREQLLLLHPFDALTLLGSTLVLFGIHRDLADIHDEKERDEHVKTTREMALTPLRNALKDTMDRRIR